MSVDIILERTEVVIQRMESFGGGLGVRCEYAVLSA